MHKGYIVNLRVIVESHQHHWLGMWIAYSENEHFLHEAKTPQQAGENAKEMIDRMMPGHVVRVELVDPVGFDDDPA